MSSEKCPAESVCRPPSYRALIPFVVFLFFYAGLSVWAQDFYKVSMPVAFLVASASAMFLDRKRPLIGRMEIYARGMGEPDIMLMCLIFILSGAFASAAKGTGAVDSAVVIARNLIPGSVMVAGIFLVSCFISLAIGTSCGTIAALTPIAAGLASPLGLDPALLLGATVGGAMFGDNLSMISDTTIAATRTQNIGMREKFLFNVKLVFPAVICTILLYLFLGRTSGPALPASGIVWKDLLNVTPYLLILLLALLGWNVMLLLFAGTVLSCAIGIGCGRMDFWEALNLIGKGTLSMSETLIVALLAGGLLKVIRHNGGISCLINGISRHVRGVRGCEFGILLLVSLVNLFTANNTVAIVIAGPIARDLSEKFHCSPRRIAGILDAGSCVVQGVIPYGAQILIAVKLAQSANLKISSLSLLGSLYYPYLLALSLILEILFHKEVKKNS